MAVWGGLSQQASTKILPVWPQERMFGLVIDNLATWRPLRSRYLIDPVWGLSISPFRHAGLYSGWWFGTWMSNFPYIGNHNPNWRTHILQRGRYTTNQYFKERSDSIVFPCFPTMVGRHRTTHGAQIWPHGDSGSHPQVEVELVLANGELVKANANEHHPELFWAIRGGGRFFDSWKATRCGLRGSIWQELSIFGCPSWLHLVALASHVLGKEKQGSEGW